MGVISHEYTACADDDCQRFPCRVYKQGAADGIEIGYQRGWADGYPQGYGDGYDRGFPDGIAACPRPHQ